MLVVPPLLPCALSAVSAPQDVGQCSETRHVSEFKGTTSTRGISLLRGDSFGVYPELSHVHRPNHPAGRFGNGVFLSQRRFPAKPVAEARRGIVSENHHEELP